MLWFVIMTSFETADKRIVSDLNSSWKCPEMTAEAADPL